MKATPQFVYQEGAQWMGVNWVKSFEDAVEYSKA